MDGDTRGVRSLHSLRNLPFELSPLEELQYRTPRDENSFGGGSGTLVVLHEVVDNNVPLKVNALRRK